MGNPWLWEVLGLLLCFSMVTTWLLLGSSACTSFHSAIYPSGFIGSLRFLHSPFQQTSEDNRNTSFSYVQPYPSTLKMIFRGPVASSPSHIFPHIPYTNPLIPPRTRRPPLRPKKTPIDSTHKLRMNTHPTQLPPSTPLLHLSLITRIRPHATRHIITSTQQRIAQMRTPRHPPNRIIMPRQHLHRPRLPSQIEGSD